MSFVGEDGASKAFLFDDIRSPSRRDVALAIGPGEWRFDYRGQQSPKRTRMCYTNRGVTPL
jgi:hypothetical protein